MKKLYKTEYDKMIDGVCNGLAEYFNMDVTLIRLLWIATFFFAIGTPIFLYIVCAIIFPKKKFK